uniref:Factor of DNA methylation 1-5/IDN2 domain-containing protein n=1 Tax=Oryza meridionalis TaxID=40149 RepID=A0A0E0BX29_9ORYZ
MADADGETHDAGGELLVWPWTGILATATDDDDATADAVSTLAFHAQQHFAGVPTTALQEAAARRRSRPPPPLLGAPLRQELGRAPGRHVAPRPLPRRREEGVAAAQPRVRGVRLARRDDLRGGDGVVVGRFLREAGGAARSAEDVERDEGRVAAKLANIAGECERRAQEMEPIYAKLHQLEKQLEQRKALESTIRQMNMNLQAGGSLGNEDYEHIYSIMVCLRTIVDEEKEMMVDSCAEIMKRLRTNSDELEEYRQELIKGFEITANTIIGIKRMGELDGRPFHLACKRKHREDDPGGKAAMLISYWQEELKNPSWHPFKIIQVDGEDKEVVDEDDPKLRQLCKDYGDSVCNAVKAAMAELNKYNPRGRHTMNELWNFREGRKAMTKEVVKYISDQLKTNSSQSDN